MRSYKLRVFVFMALCCDLGLFAKKLISPAANVITESLHIPGGIATGFSLMFLVIAASVVSMPGCATIMSVVQSVIALCFGMTGSMGLLAPIGYIIPGIVIDLVIFLFRKLSKERSAYIMGACVLSSVSACLAANLIVFRLTGIVLILYISVAASSGAVCGLVATELVKRLTPILMIEKEDI